MIKSGVAKVTRSSENWDTEGLIKELSGIMPLPGDLLDPDELTYMSRDEIEARLEELGDSVVPPTVTTTPEERDEIRRLDLEEIQAALAQYALENGAFPSTDGQRQSLCAYRSLDVGCSLEAIGHVPFEDPLTDRIQNGYWFLSQSDSYIVIARRETDQDSPSNCPEGLFEPEFDRARLCVSGVLP